VVLRGSPKDVEQQEILQRLARRLDTLGATKIASGDHTLRFRSTIFRAVPSNHILVPITSGQIVISTTNRETVARYRLSLFQIVAIGTAVYLASVVPFLFTAPNLSIHEASLLAFAAWLVLFGGNWCLTKVRFSRLIRSCAGARGNPSRSGARVE
jgi:hypothetical protein